MMEKKYNQDTLVVLLIYNVIEFFGSILVGGDWELIVLVNIIFLGYYFCMNKLKRKYGVKNDS